MPATLVRAAGRLSVLAILGVWLWSASPLARAAEPIELPPRDRLHLILLIGQSNMAGRGDRRPDDPPPHPRVLKFTAEGDWAPAADPLHFDKPAIAGVGPGSGIGPALADAAPEATIGLIPCAVGGTPLRRWERGGDLYQAAVNRARAAQRQGVLRAILWHQGEADSHHPDDAASYGRRLQQMIADLRRDLEAPDAPFIAGELGEFLAPDKFPHRAAINAALHAAAKEAPRVAVAPSHGLRAKADQVHFDAPSAREFGRRYAAALLKLEGDGADAPPE